MQRPGHRRPQNLSGGEAQRVALARALAPLPSVAAAGRAVLRLWTATASDALLARLQDLASRASRADRPGHARRHRRVRARAEVALLREGRLAALGPAAVALASERTADGAVEGF